MKLRPAAIAAISALALLEGCVTTPYGPTVPSMPGHNKSWSQFQADDGDCQDYAESRIAGRAREANNRAIGSALIGAALGAGLGAAVGGGNGAAIGAAGGAIVGTDIGAHDSRYAQGSLQGRYNIAYAQCMSSKGNRVEGFNEDEEGPPPPRHHGDYEDDNYPPPPPPPPGY